MLILEECHYDQLESRLKSERTFARRGKVEKGSCPSVCTPTANFVPYLSKRDSAGLKDLVP